jgi:hypothetical protein
MPLLHGLPFEVLELKGPVEPNEQVFVIDITGEACRNYADYVALKQEYEKRVWACNFSGLSGLTYKEALKSEQSLEPTIQPVGGLSGRPNSRSVQIWEMLLWAHLGAFVSQFPVHQEKHALEIAHHNSTQNLAQLASSVAEVINGGKENEPGSAGTLGLPSIRAFLLQAWILHPPLS